MADHGRLIDADALVPKYGNWYTEEGSEERFIGTINTIPTIEPERNKGRWLRITQGAVPEKYMCPFCRRTIEDSGVEELLSIRYPFCHCGADMRGEK